jgi:hypothetical protein
MNAHAAASGVSIGAIQSLPECCELLLELRGVPSIEVRGRRIIDPRLHSGEKSGNDVSVVGDCDCTHIKAQQERSGELDIRERGLEDGVGKKPVTLAFVPAEQTAQIHEVFSSAVRVVRIGSQFEQRQHRRRRRRANGSNQPLPSSRPYRKCRNRSFLLSCEDFRSRHSRGRPSPSPAVSPVYPRAAWDWSRNPAILWCCNSQIIGYTSDGIGCREPA